jgi:hypothetical protein
LPAAVGVPDNKPPVKFSPGGSVDPVAKANVYGDVPPVAANCTLG